MAIGFVGTGAIAEAMVHGLLKAPRIATEIVVSPRNHDVASHLAREFQEVTVARDNQHVIDACETVVLAVRPQVAETVVRSLKFRDAQTVVSVIATMDRPRLLEWIGADVTLVQAVPLPAVAHRGGVTAVYPQNKQIGEMFGTLGTAIECNTKAEYDTLACGSALMAFYFGLLDDAARWMTSKGLPAELARGYLVPLFSDLTAKARSAGPTVAFSELTKEFCTKGGLNEQVLNDFRKHGGPAALTLALETVFSRVSNNS